MDRPDIIERVLQLAASGAFTKIPAIGHKLKAEGYWHVEDHLAGGTLRRQLNRMIRESRRQLSVTSPSE